MAQEIINLTNSINDPNWLNSLAFTESWKQDLDEFTFTTSGSTGKPQPIKIHRSQLEYSAQQTLEYFHLNTGSEFLVCINTAFIGGAMMLVRGLINNSSIYISSPSSNPLRGINKIFDFMAVVPMQIESIIDAGEGDKLNKMRAIIVGGAAINTQLQAKIEQLQVPIYATYGMTETVSHIALKRLNGNSKSSYFSIIGDAQISLDSRGCLTIIGSATQNKLIVTNDIVNLINERQFEWLGRYDNIINSGGVKINPEKVEARLDQIFKNEGIQNNFFVYGESDEQLGEKVVLLFEGQPFEINKLLPLLKDNLPDYHNPKNIKFLERFVRTETGKIRRLKTIHHI